MQRRLSLISHHPAPLQLPVLDATHSDALWVADWQMLAQRRSATDVIGGPAQRALHGTWGGGGPNDWAAAAERAGNAIVAVNPNSLIFVVVVFTYQFQSYWCRIYLIFVKYLPYLSLLSPTSSSTLLSSIPIQSMPQSWFQRSKLPCQPARQVLPDVRLHLQAVHLAFLSFLVLHQPCLSQLRALSPVYHQLHRRRLQQ